MLRTIVDEEERTGKIPGGREEGRRRGREERGNAIRRELRRALKYMNDPLQNCAHVLLYFGFNCHKLKVYFHVHDVVAKESDKINVRANKPKTNKQTNHLLELFTCNSAFNITTHFKSFT